MRNYSSIKNNPTKESFNDSQIPVSFKKNTDNPVAERIKQSELAFTELKTKGYIRFEDITIQKRNRQRSEVEFISND